MRAAVFFCVDDRYFPLAATQALRALDLTGSGVQVHVFVDGAAPDPRRIAELEVHGAGRLRVHVNRLLDLVPKSVPTAGHWSRIVYGRLFAPTLIDADRLLYLDVDIALEGRLDELFALDMRGAALAAVPDVGLMHEGARTSIYNSGVMLFDNAAWRARDVASGLSDWAARAPSVRFPDQEFVNAFEAGRILPLSPRWNAQGPLLEAGLAPALRPHILHFTGGWKPWHPPSLPWHESHAAAFQARAAAAGFTPAHFRPLVRRKRSAALRAITARLRLGLYELGLRGSLVRARQTAFDQKARFFREYLRDAEANNLFADAFRLVTTASVRAAFDGRHFYGVPAEAAA